MNVLIADDEQIVLEGLQHIIDWKSLGFCICGTAADGADALQKILTLQPELTMMDIRMPKLNGLDVVRQALDSGYKGKFIILSGMSDFKLAQTAMRYGVDFYLTKPIDEEELEKAVTTVYQMIRKENKTQSDYEQYKLKARRSILQDILLDHCDYFALDMNGLHLDTAMYQVITYENYNQDYFHPAWNFADLIRVTNQDNNSFDIIEMEQRMYILLKGKFAITRFQSLLEHYHVKPQKGSPLDSVFIAYGRIVYHIQDVCHSYQDVCALSGLRFFCLENQHLIGYESLRPAAAMQAESMPLPRENAAVYAQNFASYIQSNNHMLIAETLNSLRHLMQESHETVPAIKHFLTDIYIMVKQKIMQEYPQTEIPFLANAAVFDLIDRKYYLYEIISFLSEQFELWTHYVGYTSGENVINDVLYYIEHNYQENLKLETIAPLFGYNSSYLGKIFSKKTGTNFNAYVDQVRIRAAQKLLEDNQLKVYEVAARVGYSNVDYFHKKFRKYAGTSPAEYKKKPQ